MSKKTDSKHLPMSASCITMCADFCNDNSDEAIEYGFDVLSIVEQNSISALNSSRIEELPNRLGRGRVLSITATTLVNCQRWAVNLLCGHEHSSDIAFHFNPRLLQHYVVRNARVKGQWGQEEVLTIGQFDMRKSEEFQLKIYTTDDQFFVSYNDKHICSFGFKVPPRTITHIEICGMIELIKMEMEDFDKYPVNRDDVIMVQEKNGVAINYEHEKKKTPIRSLLPEGLREDWQLEIYGTPKILPQSFSIGLRNDSHIWPACAIALELKAQFGNNMLVRNAFIDNKWGMDERIGGFKFLPNIPFSLWIRRSTKKYSIWVNEKLQAEFVFRSDPDEVSAVYIQGDVEISGIYVNKNPEKYFYG